MMTLNKIRDFLKKEEAGYDGVKYLGEWKNYKVYEPFFKDKKIKYTGLPYQILVENDKFRWAEPEECLEIIDYFFPVEEDED